MEPVLAKLKNAFFIGMTTFIGLFSGLMNTASAESSGNQARLTAPVYHGNPANLHPSAVAKPERLHRSANRSYQVRGVRYTPATSVQAFSQTGRASWYGRQFHGRLTASGERYDMNLMTAAHKTLPIPSYARVTNLANGKSVVVRINDRGPFHGSRVIDVSQAAARSLGFINSGTANVRIEQIVPDQQAAERDTGRIYVNLRHFDNRAAAQSYLEETTRQLRHMNNTAQELLLVPEGKGFVVRLGPFRQQDQADRLKQSVLASA